MTAEALVSVDEIRAAAQRLDGVVQRTPIERSRQLSALTGVELLLKCEHLQRTGSFKLRGAYNRIVQLDAGERARGVACASAGNHAQGVALSATLAGVSSTVFMPASAPLPKVQATRSYGADVLLRGDTLAETLDAALEWADEHGAVFVHPFEHRDIIAGQGTCGLEILDAVPEIGTVVVPVGGGGLIAGVATALKAARPAVRVVGVQATGAAAVPASLRAGRPRPAERVNTIADGIAVAAPGALTLAHIADRVDDVVTVSDETIARAILLLVERAKQVVEPAGAVALAAVLEHGGGWPAPVVMLLGGGNVDPLLLTRIIQSGLTEEGRYLEFRTRVADKPGALSTLLSTVAALGVNVLAVQHHRFSSRLAVMEVDVELEVETRGPEHIRELMDTLRGDGYPVA